MTTTRWLTPGRVLVIAVLFGIGIWTWNQANQDFPPADPDPRPNSSQPLAPAAGFADAAVEAGLDFHMDFLPSEQGEKFKINLYDHGSGVAVADYDSDGHQDIYFLNQLGPNALYRNRGDGTFVSAAAEAGVALGDRVCVGATFADYDNDGDQDLYVTSIRGGNVLFRNRGNGTFEDVTEAAGVTCVAHSQTAAFFDADNDGHLDLFLTNTAKWTLNDLESGSHYFPGLADLWEMAASPREQNFLYHNNQNGTFTDVTEQAGVQGDGWGGDIAAFDYDEDGLLDLFVTNMFGASHLYHNQGGTFQDVTSEQLGRTSWGAIGTKVFDFNNDGLLDLHVVDMHSDMWPGDNWDPTLAHAESINLNHKYSHVMGPYMRGDRAEEAEQRFADVFQIRYSQVVFGNTLFKRLPSGGFGEVSDAAGVETFWPWGIATGDFDNDGDEDVYHPSGMGYPYMYWPSALLMNNGDETFTDQAYVAGVEPPRGGPLRDELIGGEKPARGSRCAATADFDGDGRLELVVNNFNDHPYYFRNSFPAQPYMGFKLVGTRSNRDAVGAVVKIYQGERVLIRQVHAAGGYLSQSSQVLHFGLGDRGPIDRVEIRWPSGQRQRLDRPAVDKVHHLTEPSAEPTTA